STDTFYRIICIGVAMYITMQVFINIGGISKIIPLTGVPLPLLSYGGSSFLSVSIAIGLLVIAAKHVKQKEIELKNMRIFKGLLYTRQFLFLSNNVLFV